MKMLRSLLIQNGLVRSYLVPMVVMVAVTPNPASGAMVIAGGITANVNCSGGHCTPTAERATLNAGELQTMLGNGSVSVSTTGGAGIETKDIEVKSGITWSAQTTLSFIAQRSVLISHLVTVAGPGGLALTVHAGKTQGAKGMLFFPGGGRVAFRQGSSQLAINGTTFAMVSSVKTLAAAVAANPSGNYALQDTYDASDDGVYGSSPVATKFSGNFEGLGNSIENLAITYTQKGLGYVGLFSETDTGAVIADLRLPRVTVKAANGMEEGGMGAVGSLVGDSQGDLRDDRASGTVLAKKSIAGGLAGATGNGPLVSYSTSSVAVTGSIAGGLVGTCGCFMEMSSASGSVTAASNAKSVGVAGGLVGEGGAIDQSYATGKVKGGPDGGYLGGLVGYNAGNIVNSYATSSFDIAPLQGSPSSYVGGLAGNINLAGTAYTSYAIGGPIHGSYPHFGGFLGNGGSNQMGDDYWDTTTSGTTEGIAGGGSSNIVGLTNAQLTSGLPSGFDPTIWAEDPKINNGLPYLINNRPAQ